VLFFALKPLARRADTERPDFREHPMPRIDIASLTPWITRAALEHGADLPAQLMQRLAISRRSAGHVLRKLVALQWLVSTGTPRKPRYAPGALRQVVQRYPLEGLQEDLPWRRDFAPFFNLPGEVARMVQHGFTELVNNAIDHSGGSRVTVSMRQTPLQVQLLVSDDGVGLFERIAGSFAIDDAQLAMLELSKGKLTTQPERHSGRGLFFSSRLADVFDIHANRAAFQHRAWEPRSWRAGRPVSHQGTSIYMAITLDTARTLDAVLRAHSATGEGYDFTRTSVPLLLITGGQDASLASRADAKRAALRLAQFSEAELNFNGVAHLGHAFADELFRVFAQAQPGLRLNPVGMNPQVAAMIHSARPQAC
jgi:anti-sigma regulatory factor (Ser/Thr protein kinase)